jgi:formyl-CoA transferase
MSYDELSAQNPGLIMIRVSGYGQSGPYSKRAGYASVGEAVGGMRYLCGEPDRKPSRAGLSLGDSLAATYACMGALAALHHREKTGEGQVIDASIYESVLTVMEATIPEYTVSNHIRERSGSKLPNIAPSNIYDCKNGSIVIGANQDTIFKRLCDAMQQPELASDKRFIDHVSRGDNQDTLDQLINDWCSTRNVDEVEELMQLHTVPAGKVYRAPEMLNDPHFIDREALVDVPSERWPDLKMQNVFPKMSKTQGQIRWPGVDELGAHNNEIYEGILNLSKDQLSDLKKKSII